MNVTFLGAGLYGEALAKLVEINDHEVKFYDPYRFPEIELKDAVRDADALVYVAPAHAYSDILPGLPKDKPLILASKGFVSMQPFKEFTDFSVLGGAAFAEDIMTGKPQIGPVIRLTASSELSEQLFTTDFVWVEYTSDAKGIMLCGALKNVYAIGAGIYLEVNNPEPYFKQAFDEMRDIIELNGCSRETATLSCGLPDLIMSSSSDGRNFRFGDEIRNFPNSKLEPVGTVEGVTVIQSLADFPDFKVPSSAKLFKEIVKGVINATQ